MPWFKRYLLYWRHTKSLLRSHRDSVAEITTISPRPCRDYQDCQDLGKIAKISARLLRSHQDLYFPGKTSVTSPRVQSLGRVEKVSARSRRDFELSLQDLKVPRSQQDNQNLKSYPVLSELTMITARLPRSWRVYQNYHCCNLAWTTEKYFYEK